MLNPLAEDNIGNKMGVRLYIAFFIMNKAFIIMDIIKTTMKSVSSNN